MFRLITLLVIAMVVVGLLVYSYSSPTLPQPVPVLPTQSVLSDNDQNLTEVIATGLDTPWAISFLPEGGMLVTERPGRVRYIDSNGVLSPTPVATINEVRESGEGGLLGMALHPGFSENNYVYLYYTYDSTGDNTRNRVVRMTYKNFSLSDPVVIVDAIPGAGNHNGGRIAFGPDNFLYITTGDAGKPSEAQNTSSLAGKILRVKDDGSPAPDNPFNNSVFSYGHRNPQGIDWESSGRLWSTEHGRSGLSSGFDELNWVRIGRNYGWPDIEGDKTSTGMEPPALHSGASSTWAPGGTAITGNHIYFSGLRGESLYRVTIDGDNLVNLKEFFKNEFGRIREVVLDPDGFLYITTSNHDGRGDPVSEDDRIIRINISKL